MDYSRKKYLEICQEFFEAYIRFRLEGTEEHWIKHNNRNIQINFFDHGDFVSVELRCSEILRSLSGVYDGSAQKTQELLRMILWLALDVEDLDVFHVRDTCKA